MNDEVDAKAIEEWAKSESIKREREVQEAAVRAAEAQRLMLERQEVRSAIESQTAARAGEMPAGWRSKGTNGPSTTRDLIEQVCDEFKGWLLDKNAQYGDSAIKPVRVFSAADEEEQLKVRLDDKLSRLMRGDDRIEPDEDIMWDFCGYWILLQVVRRKAERAE